MPTALCAVVTAAEMEDLVRARDAADGADLVELRLDTVARPDVPRALANRRLPAIVTCRAAWEGGGFAGAEEDRERLLTQAIDLGAEFVDVEFAAPFRPRLVARAPDRVVVSLHDFGGTPPDLADRFAAMRATGAAIVKIAVMTPRLADQLPVFALARALPDGDRHVLIGMGEAGAATRVLGARLGNAWTYAGASVAPGQIELARMAEEFRHGLASPAPRLFGVIGRPIGHSMSPAMHNAALRAAGIDGCYLPLAAADMDDFTAFADAMGLDGASVTAPFKRAALALSTDRDELALRVGAANTLARGDDGRWRARNTDVAGFLAPIGDLAPGQRVAVLGAGGAARAVAVACGSRGARVTVHARRAAAARRLAEDLGVAWAEWPPSPGSWDVLVNSTPVGTWPHDEISPLEPGRLDGALVYDLVYNPPATRLLREAAAIGCRTIGGLDMLVAQAADQFTWWTGRPAPAAVMRRAAERALARHSAPTMSPTSRSLSPTP